LLSTPRCQRRPGPHAGFAGLRDHRPHQSLEHAGWSHVGGLSSTATFRAPRAQQAPAFRTNAAKNRRAKWTHGAIGPRAAPRRCFVSARAYGLGCRQSAFYVHGKVALECGWRYILGPRARPVFSLACKAAQELWPLARLSRFVAIVARQRSRSDLFQPLSHNSDRAICRLISAHSRKLRLRDRNLPRPPCRQVQCLQVSQPADPMLSADPAGQNSARWFFLWQSAAERSGARNGAWT